MNKIKRLISISLVIAFLFSFSATAVFADTADDLNVKTAAELLESLQIIGGYPDGTFKPQAPVTRAEFAKILFVTINGSGSEELYHYGNPNLSDVTADKWFCSYVNWANTFKIIEGRDDGTFDPDAKVTFAEASKMYIRALGYSDELSWPYGFIDKAKKIGIFEDILNAQANDPAMRGSVAIMTYNVLFASQAPRFSTVSGGETIFEAPIEAVFEIHGVRTVLEGTSTRLPNNSAATIRNSGKISFASKDKTKTVYGIDGGAYDYSSNIDELVGHSVDVWFKDENKDQMLNSAKDEIIFVADAASRSVKTEMKDIKIAQTSEDGLKKYDLYVDSKGNKTRLFEAVYSDNKVQKTDLIPNTNGSGADVTDIKYKFYNDINYYGVVPSNVIINGATSEAGFDSYIRLPSSDCNPNPQNITATFNFVDNDYDDENAWDKIFIDIWKTAQVEYISGEDLMLKGVNGGQIIEARQISGDLSGLKEDDFVNYTVSDKVVNSQILTCYTIEKAEVIEDVKLNYVMGGTYDLGGTKYSFTDEWFAACDAVGNGLPYTTLPYRAASFDKLQVGSSYDIVLTKSGFIFAAFLSSGLAEDKYMLIKSVGVRDSGFSSKTVEATGLLADGTTKTFAIDNSGFGISTAVVINNDTIFDPNITSTGGWTAASDNSKAAADGDIAAIGKLVKYTLNTNGQISSISQAGDKHQDSQYKYDKIEKTIFERTSSDGGSTYGSYSLAFIVDSASVFFIYDKGDDVLGSDQYEDDKFVVYTSSTMSAFKDVAFESFVPSDEEGSNTINMAYMISSATNITPSGLDENLKLAYLTKNTAVISETDTTVKFGIQLVIDGASKWYFTSPIDIKAVKGDPVNTNKVILKKVLAAGPSGAVHNSINNGLVTSMYADITGYAEIDSETGTLLKIYANGYDKGNVATTPVNVDPQQAVAADVTESGASLFNRGGLVSIKNNFITVAKVQSDGSAVVLMNTSDTEDGKKYSYGNAGEAASKAIFRVADNCRITVFDNELTETGILTGTKGSLSDMSVSSDMGKNYVIEYVLRHEIPTDEDTPLVVTDIIYYDQPVSNVK